MSTPFVPYRESRLLRAIPDEVLRATSPDPQIIQCPQGCVIFEELDPPDGCYIVESGSVRISKTGENGEQETLDFVGPGGFFGELSLYNPAPRSARATAAVATQIARLDRELFERLRHAAPLEMTNVLAEVSIERLLATDAHLIDRLREAGRLREVGATLGTIAHNLRSPLATIRNAADLLLETLADSEGDAEQAARLAEIIRRTTQLALESSDQLLAKVRGEERASRVMVPIDQIVQEALAQVSGLFDSSRVSLEAEIGTRAPVRIERAEITSAVTNLLRNAIEALPPEGGTVRVAVHERGADVLIDVADSGCGIRPEHVARIFEFRFTHGKSGGTGLGLAHAKDVCERHGGWIEVESELGRGTNFRIHLPAAL